jgi:NAD kinase
LNRHFPKLNYFTTSKYLLNSSKNEFTPNIHLISDHETEELKKIDIILAFGGDGTIFHSSSLFQTLPVPSILPFSLGSLSFLSNFCK